MSSATFVKDFNEAFEFTFVNGTSNEYVIHTKTPRPASRDAEKEMTSAEWDKFETDITEAFEQVP